MLEVSRFGSGVVGVGVDDSIVGVFRDRKRRSEWFRVNPAGSARARYRSGLGQSFAYRVPSELDPIVDFELPLS